MQKRLNELRLQRGRLLERIAHQRDTLARQAHPLARGLRVGERLDNWFQQCKQVALQHPVAVVTVVGAVVILRPAFVLRWTRRGFIAWRTWLALRRDLPGFLTRLL